METTPDLSVSIVTYNSQDCLETLFASLAAQEGVAWELFIVDNASTDRTPDILSQRGLGQVTKNARNAGFGRGHNQNGQRFRGRYLLFLNPDMELPPGLFTGLVRFLDNNPSIAIAGPKVLEGPSLSPFPPRLSYPGQMLMPVGPALAAGEPAWVNGCCLAIRRRVFEDIGAFDPDYFLYFEEVDLCWRARQAGLQLGWLPQFEVRHYGRGSQRNISEYEQARELFAGAVLFWEKRYTERDQAAMLRVQVLAAQLLLTASRLFKSRWPAYEGLRPARLQARRDICREWLVRHGFGPWSLDPRCLRIAMRLARVGADWALRRRFPFDDV
jgi:N-acetylglucosaminyl-diphospho-decaprenol L-rhamnosyltransferase